MCVRVTMVTTKPYLASTHLTLICRVPLYYIPGADPGFLKSFVKRGGGVGEDLRKKSRVGDTDRR
jgi:hypothetical protein